jgi:excisionase family DNA binding protein
VTRRSDIPQLGHNGGTPLNDDLLSMTVKTAMRITGLSKDAIYDLLAAREIRGFLMGSRRYIEGASLRAYVERRAVEPLMIRRSPKPRVERQAEPRTGAEPERHPQCRQKSLPSEHPSRGG